MSKTKIYARSAHADASRQFLVYAMNVAIEEDVAMVLPLPVPPAPSEDAVSFVDLSSCPRFFAELDVLFPDPALAFAPQSLSRHGRLEEKKLVVHDVGDFEASFVPTLEDFDRLDARFRLPEGVWDALPQYADWGFAVFKLRPAKVEAPRPRGFFARLFGSGARGAVETVEPAERHPMAFEFPRRDPSRLFFPTVHVHDGEAHATAKFDHALYCQHDREPADWQVSVGKASSVYGKAKEWLREDALAYKRVLSGDLPNVDQHV